MVNGVDFAARLEKILGFYGLTASALAEEIDFNRSTISHLVSGRNKPSLEFVMKILQRFKEVDLDWLVSGKGVFPSSSIESHKTNENSNEAHGSSKKIEAEPTASPLDLKPMTRAMGKEIERIVVFYEDGTFKNYEN